MHFIIALQNVCQMFQKVSNCVFQSCFVGNLMIIMQWNVCYYMYISVVVSSEDKMKKSLLVKKNIVDNLQIISFAWQKGGQYTIYCLRETIYNCPLHKGKLTSSYPANNRTSLCDSSLYTQYISTSGLDDIHQSTY